MRKILTAVLSLLILAGCTTSTVAPAAQPAPEVVNLTYLATEQAGSRLKTVKTVQLPIPAEPVATPPTETVDLEAEYDILAQLIWGEARGCSITEQAAVVWCVLNRVEDGDPYHPDSIIDVVKQSGQFTGYRASNPIVDEHRNLAIDVVGRWLREQEGEENVGRVLPREYMWFYGDGEHNHFRNAYKGDFDTWDWSLTSPYSEEVANE